MSSFKDFKTWLGLVVWPNGGFFFPLIIICLVVSVLLAISLIGPGDFLEIPFLNLWAKIIIIIPCSIVVFLFFLGEQNGKITNWRIAIYEARKFAEKNILTENGYLLWLIENTERIKDPVELNEWIANYTEWKQITEDLEKLFKEREQIPQKIKEKKEQRLVLNDKLFKRPFKS